MQKEGVSASHGEAFCTMNTQSYTMELPFTVPVSEDTDIEVARGIVIKKDKTHYRVFIGGAKAFECAAADYYYKKLVIATLIDLGCEKMSIARGLEVHRNTVTNIESSARQYGMEGLIDGRDGRPGPRKMTPAVVKLIASWYRKGLSASEVYRRLQGKIDPSITDGAHLNYPACAHLKRTFHSHEIAQW